jgi:hypothetical protein
MKGALRLLAAPGRRAICGAALAVCLAAGRADAGFILPDEGMALSDLIGVAFQVDDKEFFISSFDASGMEAADILVTPVNLGMDATGFDLNGDFTVRGDDDDLRHDEEIIEFTLVYTVDALSPGRLITDAHLAFDGSATGDDDDTFGGGDDDDGEAIATVMESIFTGRGDLLGELQVLADSNIHPDDWVLVDDIVFDPQMSLTVTKTALFRAIGDDDDLLLLDCDSIASATFIRQTFSQIPAPGSLWLLGLAGAVAGIRRRQR